MAAVGLGWTVAEAHAVRMTTPSVATILNLPHWAMDYLRRGWRTLNGYRR
jgi:hypothetical protein